MLEMISLNDIFTIVHGEQIVKFLSFMVHIVKLLILTYSYDIMRVAVYEGILQENSRRGKCITNYLKREKLEK